MTLRIEIEFHPHSDHRILERKIGDLITMFGPASHAAVSGEITLRDGSIKTVKPFSPVKIIEGRVGASCIAYTIISDDGDMAAFSTFDQKYVITFWLRWDAPTAIVIK